MEIKDMNFEQLKKYLEEQTTLHPTAAWRKRGALLYETFYK